MLNHAKQSVSFYVQLVLLIHFALLTQQKAFMRGKLKLKGNMALALKLQTVMDAAKKQFDAGMAQTTEKKSSIAPHKSEAVFDMIRTGVQADGAALVRPMCCPNRFYDRGCSWFTCFLLASCGLLQTKKVNGVILFEIVPPGVVYTLGTFSSSNSLPQTGYGGYTCFLLLGVQILHMELVH